MGKKRKTKKKKTRKKTGGARFPGLGNKNKGNTGQTKGA